MRPAPTSKKIMCKRPQGLIVCCFSRRVVSYSVYNRESEYGYNQMKIHWRIQSKGLGGWHSLKLHSPKEWCTWSGHVYIYTVFSCFFLHLFPPYLDRIRRFRVGVWEVQGSRLIFLTGSTVRFILSAACTGILTSDPARWWIALLICVPWFCAGIKTDRD